MDDSAPGSYSSVLLQGLEQSEETSCFPDPAELDTKGLYFDEQILYIDDLVPDEGLQKDAHKAHLTAAAEERGRDVSARLKAENKKHKKSARRRKTKKAALRGMSPLCVGLRGSTVDYVRTRRFCMYLSLMFSQEEMQLEM